MAFLRFLATLMERAAVVFWRLLPLLNRTAIPLVRRMEHALPRLPPILNGTTVWFAQVVPNIQARSLHLGEQLNFNEEWPGALMFVHLPSNRFALICRGTGIPGTRTAVILSSLQVRAYEWSHEETQMVYQVRMETPADFWALLLCFGLRSTDEGWSQNASVDQELAPLIAAFTDCLEYGAFGGKLALANLPRLLQSRRALYIVAFVIVTFCAIYLQVMYVYESSNSSYDIGLSFVPVSPHLAGFVPIRGITKSCKHVFPSIFQS
ncbi:uncharacterized protein B0H18DRAFT_955889 [Fomitopsis serialis]|uniref:uncharacterized protein n=1 Tax=Fomitopsis serialis TaxID=139415 RepID=UPI002007BF4B|nr:uncharacterized protein B0H18DRAFT_955889 [Neoantrodia serialis]KAH9923339.1 hypothetical protein B0H18DRAFT_955889 [Neoantrodia serialis]